MIPVKKDNTIGIEEVDYCNLPPEVVSSDCNHCNISPENSRNLQLMIAQDQKKECHYTPKDSDIIIGNASNTINHAGNIKFRDLIKSRVNAYTMLSSRKEKSEMVSNIIFEIKANGANFIKKDSKTNKWFVLDKSAERRKVAQTFANIAYRSDGNDSCSNLVKATNAQTKKLRKLMRTTPKSRNNPEVIVTNKSNVVPMDVSSIHKRQVEAIIRLRNEYMIEFHKQSILKLQQQNLDLPSKAVASNNCSIIGNDQLCLFSSYSLDAFKDRNIKCINTSNNAAQKLLAKKDREEKIAKRRIEKLWRSLPDI